MAVPKSIQSKALKYYTGQMGKYHVIANKGENEAAMCLSLVSGPAKVKTKNGDVTVPTFGLGFRIRFYDREQVGSNPFKGFTGTDTYGKHDGAPVHRVKKYIPISHQGLGVYGLAQVWRAKGCTADLIKELKTLVKKSGGKMVASDAQLTVLIEQGFEGVPLKAPNVYAGFPLSGSVASSFSGTNIQEKSHPTLQD